MKYVSSCVLATVLGVATSLLVACSAEGTPGGCRLTSDCPMGQVCTDGRCSRVPDGGTPPATDEDGDGIEDHFEGRDAGIDTDGDGTPDYLDADSDGDGIPDAEERGTVSPEAPLDSDGDGIPDFQDRDSDGDGIDDAREGGPTVDTDGDGRPDYLDRDSDGDGILDAVEGAPPGSDGSPPDTDGDGIPDFRDLDSDGDSLPDADEGSGDVDGDGIVDFRDPLNDGPITPITLTAISTEFNTPIGIDYHEPTNTMVFSVHYPAGTPYNFERIDYDGTHAPFSSVSGLTEEVKIGTVRSGNPGGFVTGDLFVGNGVDGQIARVTDGGATVISPWVDLPGSPNGLMRGSLHVDRTGVFGGDLIAVTTYGEVYRIDSGGTPTAVAALPGTWLEGCVVVPNAPARYGPLAGRIIAGSESYSAGGRGLLYAFAPDGTLEGYDLDVEIEDIEIVPVEENFFGVNFGTSRILGAPASEFASFVGDILLTQETHTASGLFVLRWNGSALVAIEIPLTAESAPVGQWEHVAFGPAGIVEIPPLI